VRRGSFTQVLLFALSADALCLYSLRSQSGKDHRAESQVSTPRTHNNRFIRFILRSLVRFDIARRISSSWRRRATRYSNALKYVGAMCDSWKNWCFVDVLFLVLGAAR
jgi:hypothetical protein